MDQAENLWFAMDLKPLIQDKTVDPGQYVLEYIEEFKQDVNQKINRFL
ncbi:MAG: hypothetical protein HRT44_09200 [Bdellovibrionales bacterium]|nr:hypothetical protein [Bdellovibrionales bacterium]